MNPFTGETPKIPCSEISNKTCTFTASKPIKDFAELLYQGSLQLPEGMRMVKLEVIGSKLTLTGYDPRSSGSNQISIPEAIVARLESYR